MSTRPTWLLIVLPVACAVACASATDGGSGDGNGLFAGGPTNGGDTATGASDAPGAGSGGGGADSSGTPGGSGAPPSGSSGAPPTGAGAGSIMVKDVFQGAPAFVAQIGPTMRKLNKHNFPGNVNGDAAGVGCNNPTCHNFVAGGTLYADYKGLKRAVGVEVRIMDAAGNAASAWTDADGNFRLKGVKVQFPYWIGVRDGTTTRPMVTKVIAGQGGCSMVGCHLPTNPTGIAHVP